MHTYAGSQKKICTLGLNFNLKDLSSDSHDIVPLRPVSLSVYELIIEIFWNWFCCNYDSNDTISPQFCTCHDSWAAVACAKLLPDLIIIYHGTVTRTFAIFELINSLWNGSLIMPYPVLLFVSALWQQMTWTWLTPSHLLPQWRHIVVTLLFVLMVFHSFCKLQ